MKKLLLGTTALIGAVSFASVAAADAPRVTVGGFIDFQAAHVGEDLDSARRSYGFRNDTEIHFNVDGKTDSGLGYGAVVELEADTTDDTTGSGTNADRTYIYLDGGWGRFELGSNSDAATALKVDASSIARATGGIDGDWFRFATPVAGSWIVRPDLPVSHGGTVTPGATENASKITYYSPSFSGFQVGLSYAPDSAERGQTATFTDTDGSYEDVFSGGVTYAHQFDQVNLGLSATFESGDSEVAGEDLEAWALGASLGFGGFSVAASWADVNESLSGASDLEGDFWTLGAAYDFGSFGLSATYLDSTQEVTTTTDNDFTNFSIGADYAMAPGMTPYLEVSFFEYDAPGAVLDNDGTVFIVGTQLAF